MLVVNENNLPEESFSAHGGKGKMHIRFAFKEHQGYGNQNDSGWQFFGIAEFPEGTTAGMHTHNGDDEFFYILEGEAIIVQDNQERTINAGDIVLTRSGSTHGIKKVIRKLKFITIEIPRKND